MQCSDFANHTTKWVIRKFASEQAFENGDSYDEVLIDGNLFLNEGIGEIWDLVCGLGSPNAFNNANARIGVGDSSAAESAAHTDLQAATNKTYKAMESGYPQRSGQTVTFQSVFGASDANYAWQEFTVDNGSGNDININRKISDQGTKASGQVWTLELQITLT